MNVRMIILGLALMLMNTGYVFAEEGVPVKTDVSKGAVSEEAEEAPKYCPICGPEEETHGLALGYKYKGKKYTFCSMGCLKAFKQDPEQYLKEKNSEDDHGHEGQDQK